MREYKWAFIGTGSIVRKFLVGLKHVEGAVAEVVLSRSQEKAESFAKELGINRGTKYYESILSDPAIKFIYIGTPHSTHLEYALKAFKAGKAVLCEKPVTMNTAELKMLLATAQENNVLFMEAVWTRFLPVMAKVRSWISDGLIGEIRMVEANFGFTVPWNPEGRLLNIHLGGGSLLDACMYPITFSQMVYQGKTPNKIQGLLQLGETHVDEKSHVILSFGNRGSAVLSAALSCPMVNDGWIYGTLGKIHVPDFVFARHATLHVTGKYEEKYYPDFESNGYNYEAEEMMRLLENGKIESDIMPWCDSLSCMEIMDEVRKQNNFYYPFEKM